MLERSFTKIGLLPEVQGEDDPYNKNRIIFWKQTQQKVWQRISNDPLAEIVTDGEVQWTKAFIQEFEEVKRTLWQKLAKSEIAGAINGPKGQEMKALQTQRRDAFLFWMREVGLDIEEELNKRWSDERKGISKLGTSIVVLEGKTPLRKDINAENYIPNQEPLITEDIMRTKYDEGMRFILGQVSDIPGIQDDYSVRLLRELKTFRQEKVRWAALDGNSLVALEPNIQNGAWLIMIPIHHRLVQEQPSLLAVDTNTTLNILTIKPLAITKEWAGIAGVHELQHLNDFVTGREPKQPNRQQYIDGEVRAFSSEIAAANILSRGQFSQTLEAVIHEYKLQDYDDIHSIGTTNIEKFINICRDLDICITKKPPQSNSEVGIRFAFYSIAIAFYLSEMHAKNEQERINMRSKVIEKVYGPKNLLPKN